MNCRIYLSPGFEVIGDGSSDELYLLEHNGRIVGYSSEFEMCTYDIAKAASMETARDATWLSWGADWSFTPASLSKIKMDGLLDYVLGYRRKMHLGEPILPIGEFDSDLSGD